MRATCSSARATLGLFGLSCGTLLAEVALTRVLSAGLFHHIAFLVVSTAMLGTGAAGVLVSGASRERRRSLPAVGSLVFALGLPLCFTLSQLVGVEPLELAAEPIELLRLLAVYLLLTTPFFGTGIAVASVLDRDPAEVPRLYAADLAGAGSGSFLALFGLAHLGGAGAILAASAIGALASVCFVRNAKGRAALIAGASVLAVLSWSAESRVPLYVSRSKVTESGEPFRAILADPERARWTRWSSMARIDRIDFGRGRSRLVIDGGSAVVRIPPDGRVPGATDATLPYELRPGGRVLILGAGAGWELQEALHFGAARVDAVEINAVIAGEVPRPIAARPEVRVLVEEGRSFLERSRERYAAIVMVHTISNAATTSGALHLAEDYLFTVEAVSAMLDRLGDDGVLFITRPEAQLPRLLITLREAWAARDRRPLEERAYAWAERSAASTSFYGALLFSPAGFSRTEDARVRERIRARGLALRVAPGEPPEDPVLRDVMEGATAKAIEARVGARMAPPTDDRPFFHQRRSILALSLPDVRRALSSGRRARMALEDEPIAEISSVLLLLESVLIGAALLAASSVVARRRGQARRIRAAIYFGGIGLGFMLIEIGLVQKLGLLVGHPALSFATVFAGLLVGAGAGSASSRFLGNHRVAAAACAALALLLAAAVPAAVQAALPLPEAARIAVGLAIAFPAGVFLGTAFPLGLLALRGEGEVPWAFGVNALASVTGAVLAALAATEIGFTGVLGSAGFAYAAAAIAGVRSASDPHPNI